MPVLNSMESNPNIQLFEVISRISSPLDYAYTRFLMQSGYGIDGRDRNV